MTVQQILDELQTLGRESYKRVLMQNHGVQEPCFGVAISAMAPLRKKIGQDYRLALELYETGNYDAMYLAGLVADDAAMTREDLNRWVARAYGGSLPGTTVPSVAAGGPHGHALAREWIGSPHPLVAVAGWATWSCLVSVLPDSRLDLDELKGLLSRIEKTLPASPDAVRYQMNSYVICAGSYVPALTDLAIETSGRIGPVQADLGNNACQIPDAAAYIRKVQALGKLGKKRKKLKC